MVGVGIAIGIASALSVSGLLGSTLYGVSPTDGVTYATVIGLLMITGLVACTVPAWRASTIRPMNALRSD